MDRRALLAAMTPLLSGCSTLFGGESSTPTTAQAVRTARDSPSDDGPILPYRSADPRENLDRPHDIEIYNRTERPQFVTVAVDDGATPVVVRNDSIPPRGSLKHLDLVVKKGLYRVVVETAEGGRAIHEWIVAERWRQKDLVVYLTDDGIETEQFDVCQPTCPPIESSGTSIDLPREDPTDPGNEVVGAVRVRNALSQSQQVSIRIRDGERPILDYRYQLPAGVTIIVPAIDRAGAYELRVIAAGRSFTRLWRLPEDSFPNVAITEDGPQPVCERSGPVRVVGVRNSTAVPRELALQIRADGETVVDERFDLEANESRTDLPGVPVDDHLDVTVSTNTGATAFAEWTFCPPETISVVVLDGVLYLNADGRVIVWRYVDETRQ